MRVEVAGPGPWLASRVKILLLVRIPSGVKVPSRLRIPVGRDDLSLRPMMWMFVAILVTFVITRIVTRLIRSGSGAGAGLGNVRIAGNHVHHQVFGILIIIGTGIVLISQMPRGAALDVAAVVFGVGVGLTVDEFALWLHLEDVYWTDQGRKSVDAIFCVLVITGALIGGADFVTGRIGTAAWWSSVAVIAVNLLLCVICLLKGKVVTGVTGIVVGIVALVGAIRLAKPGSWWAVHRYASRPRRAERAASRYGQHHQERWNRLRDLVAGAPSQPAGLPAAACDHHTATGCSLCRRTGVICGSASADRRAGAGDGTASGAGPRSGCLRISHIGIPVHSPKKTRAAGMFIQNQFILPSSERA